MRKHYVLSSSFLITLWPTPEIFLATSRSTDVKERLSSLISYLADLQCYTTFMQFLFHTHISHSYLPPTYPPLSIHSVTRSAKFFSISQTPCVLFPRLQLCKVR